MSQSLDLRSSKLILALALILIGGASIFFLNRIEFEFGGRNYTSISLLLAALVFYAGIVVIVDMLRNETLLTISLLLPSIVAVAVFVYGFIAWSARVSLSKWKGLLPDTPSSACSSTSTCSTTRVSRSTCATPPYLPSASWSAA